jgi:4-hydroxybenzoate polyprenyltransferase
VADPPPTSRPRPPSTGPAPHGSTPTPARGSLILGLVRACHPLPSLAVTTAAVLLSIGVGLPPGTVVLLAAAVLCGQLSIGWSNDRIDAARDTASGRTDKPAAHGAVALTVLTTAAGAALVATVVFSALLGWAAATAHLIGVAAGWAYNLGLKGTLWSGVAYLVAFAALPAVPYLAQPGHPAPPWWVCATGALLGLAAHFANVLPDLNADAATGVRGLPHRLGPRGSIIAMAGALALAAVILAAAPPGRTAAFTITAAVLGIALAAAAALAALRNPASSAAFRLTVIIAVLDAVLLITLATRT